MRKHEKLTVDRVKKFRDNLNESYYKQITPMQALIHKSKEPVPFDEVQYLDFHPIVPGTKWGENFDCAWFRFSGVVPDEFKGKHTLALVDVGGEACVFDQHGNPVQGLTNKRIEWTMTETIIKKRIHLLKSAKGGEKIELLIDAGANNILGIENVLTYESMIDGIFNQADLAVFDREAWGLFLDVDLLFQMVQELPEKTRRRKLILYALNEAVNAYGSGSPDEIRKCRKILKPELAKPANASALKVSAIGHAHIDIAWLWPLRETIRKTSRTFSTALNLMQEYPDYKFGASQPVLYEFMKEHYPGLYKRVAKAVKNKQWECQGAMWVEADCNLTSGESLVRQILYGKAFYKEEFDVEVDNLWLPDVFGYSASLPQLLKKSDVNYFMSQKMSWNQFNKFPHNTFIWEGIDGTRIFTHFLAPNNYRSDCSVKDMLNLEFSNSDIDRTEYALFLYGAGDGGGGPSRQYIEKIKRMEDIEGMPKVKMEFAADFFYKTEKTARDLQLWVGELYLELHRGTLTSQASTKKYNRKLEFAFRDVEYLYGVYNINHYPQDQLEKNWKVLLMNQFHDIIPGTSITRVHIESNKQYREIEKELMWLQESVTRKILSKLNTGDVKHGVLVINNLNWDRNEVLRIEGSHQLVQDMNGNSFPVQMCEDNGGKYTLAQVTVPSMGHKVFALKTKKTKVQESGLVVSDRMLENSLIRIEFSKEGRIKSIVDKEMSRQVLQGEGNVFSLYEDIPILWDAWDLDVYYEEKAASHPQLVSGEIVEHGPLRAALRFKYKDTNYSIVQTVYLEHNTKRIDFDTLVDWQEENHMLRVEFPVNVRAEVAAYEIQYGHVKRPTHYNTSWDMAKFEVVGHKWADLSQPNYGVALLNDCKYGYKIKGNTLSLNLLRSPKNPDRLADMHVHQFKYSLLPHKGDLIAGDVIRQAYALNVPLQVVPFDEPKAGVLPPEVSFMKVEAPNVVVESLKKAEKSSETVIRFYETDGIDCKVVIAFHNGLKTCRLVNLLEKKIRDIPIIEDHKIELDFGMFEINTIMVST